LIAGLVAQKCRHALFGQAAPVMRCGVEIADTGIPSALHDGKGVGITDRPPQIAKAGPAQ